MSKTIVQYKISGLLEKEDGQDAGLLSEIIKRLDGAELISVLPYQSTHEHSCSLSTEEDNSFVDIVTRLPSECLLAPEKYSDIIRGFVIKALDNPMLTLEQQLYCPKEHFYVVEAYNFNE